MNFQCWAPCVGCCQLFIEVVCMQINWPINRGFFEKAFCTLRLHPFPCYDFVLQHILQCFAPECLCLKILLNTWCELCVPSNLGYLFYFVIDNYDLVKSLTLLFTLRSVLVIFQTKGCLQRGREGEGVGWPPPNNFMTSSFIRWIMTDQGHPFGKKTTHILYTCI